MIDALHHHLSRSAERDEHGCALVLGDDVWSYGRLERYSNQLAWLLRDIGIEPGDRVALAVAKSPAAIGAMHGVLKADGIYVPLDVASPPQRLARILATAAPSVLIADATSTSLVEALTALGALQDIEVGALDDLGGSSRRVDPRFEPCDLVGRPCDPPPTQRSGHDVAHILFTSGSTGFPKGVAITHANVQAFLAWAIPYFGIGPDDRMSGHPPLHFDLSTFDVFGAMASGACLHLVPPAASVVPRGLIDFITEARLTQWFSVPSALGFLVQHRAITPGAFPELRRLLWCGEVMPTPTLMALMELLPHVRFTNLYGPTEATIASSYHTFTETLRSAVDSMPIGRPCAGEELYVLDDDLRPTASGEIGQIFIAGLGLSPGYWGDERRTAEAFVPNPFDATPGARLYRTGDLGRCDSEGRFYCLGRSDSQIKSRGYRIELGEIEAALAALGALDACAVVATTSGGFEGATICCAYVASGEVDEVKLRVSLDQLLPRYMVPTRWLRMQRLPANANGKIDRPALVKRFEEARR